MPGSRCSPPAGTRVPRPSPGSRPPTRSSPRLSASGQRSANRDTRARTHDGPEPERSDTRGGFDQSSPLLVLARPEAMTAPHESAAMPGLACGDRGPSRGVPQRRPRRLGRRVGLCGRSRRTDGACAPAADRRQAHLLLQPEREATRPGPERADRADQSHPTGLEPAAIPRGPHLTAASRATPQRRHRRPDHPAPCREGLKPAGGQGRPS